MKILANPQVRKITSQSDLMTSDDYAVTIKPSVYMMPSPNTSQKFIDVMEVGEVTIRFKINFDARSWGIKGARIEIVPNKLLIEVVILESTDTRDDKYVKTIQFDTSGIELFQKQGSEITITNLTLYINENFSINYKKSMFEGTTMMGS